MSTKSYPPNVSYATVTPAKDPSVYDLKVTFVSNPNQTLYVTSTYNAINIPPLEIAISTTGNSGGINVTSTLLSTTINYDLFPTGTDFSVTVDGNPTGKGTGNPFKSTVQPSVPPMP